MGLYVNSGNMLTHKGFRFKSGSLVPDEIVNMWSKEDRQRLMDNKIIVEREPQLDKIVDAKIGSALINKGSDAPEKENFASKQLAKEIDDSCDENKPRRGRPPKQ